MATSTERERLERILRGQQDLMDQVHTLLAEEQKHDDILRAVVRSSTKERIARIPGMDPERIFSTAAIKALCVRYRLRFLDAGLFKGELPLQAVHAIRALERKADGPLHSFKVMAPAERFKLCDSEVDPLLFVPVAEDRYYLVHKWGTDLSWHRALRGWPFRGAVNLIATVLACAVLLTFLVPGSVLEGWGVARSLFLLWNCMVLASFTVFGWFAFFGQFSSQAWNSKYFN